MLGKTLIQQQLLQIEKESYAHKVNLIESSSDDVTKMFFFAIFYILLPCPERT